jgi:hypothetical protein
VLGTEAPGAGRKMSGIRLSRANHMNPGSRAGLRSTVAVESTACGAGVIPGSRTRGSGCRGRRPFIHGRRRRLDLGLVSTLALPVGPHAGTVGSRLCGKPRYRARLRRLGCGCRGDPRHRGLRRRFLGGLGVPQFLDQRRVLAAHRPDQVLLERLDLHDLGGRRGRPGDLGEQIGPGGARQAPGIFASTDGDPDRIAFKQAFEAAAGCGMSKTAARRLLYSCSNHDLMPYSISSWLPRDGPSRLDLRYSVPGPARAHLSNPSHESRR